MPADEVTRGMDVESSRVRTGPRHAAPKKPLFTRFHVPAGKAIALAAMPTAVLMGMGFTPTLAIADGNDATAPASNSLTADEYQACVAALEGAGKDASPTPTPSPSATDGADDGKTDDETDGKGDDGKGDAGEPSPSASEGDGDQDGGKDAGTDTDTDTDQGGSSSSDSGSDDKDPGGDKGTDPAPSPSATASAPAAGSRGTQPSPSGSEEAEGGLLDGIGDALGGLLGGGEKADDAGATGATGATGDAQSPSPEATPSASPSGSATGDTAKDAVDDVTGAVKDTTGKVTGTVKDTVDGVTGKASEAAEDTAEGAGDTVDQATGAVEDAEKAAEEAGDEATASPAPSASESADPEDCPIATDAEGGVDNPVPLPDDPWYLGASSLLLKGASYKGVVEVKTANGTTKKVLKYVISDGTDIGDLHQTVKDAQAGKTYHVQAAKGSTSTIRDGDTVMYTESISGNLLGLIPITFDPENPPPLDLPLIYFTKVTVVQAGQFGGTLHIPGLHQYTTD